MNQSSNAPHCELTLDGQSTPLTCEYELMFRQRPAMPPEPVLYFRGLRVIRAWSIRIAHSAPADPFGISGGRDIAAITDSDGTIAGETKVEP